MRTIIIYLFFFQQAAAVVDHLSQSDPAPAKKARLSVDEIKNKIKQEIKEEPTFKTVSYIVWKILCFLINISSMHTFAYIVVRTFYMQQKLSIIAKTVNFKVIFTN